MLFLWIPHQFLPRTLWFYDFRWISQQFLWIFDGFLIVLIPFIITYVGWVRTLWTPVHWTILTSKSNVMLMICSVVLWMTNDNVGISLRWRNFWLLFGIFDQYEWLGCARTKKQQMPSSHTLSLRLGGRPRGRPTGAE